MELNQAISTVLSGGEVGPADEAIAATAGGAERLVAEFFAGQLGKDALTAENGFNTRRFKRILDICQRAEWPGCAAALSPLLTSPRTAVRTLTATAIVARGDQSAGETLQKLLAESDKEAASGALEGVRVALKQNRANPEFRRMAFETISADLLSDEKRNLYPLFLEPPAMLMSLDAVRAAEFLTSAKVLTEDNPCLDDVLRAVEKFNLKVDFGFLRELLPHLRSPISVVDYLSKNDPMASENLIQEQLGNTDASVRARVLDALLRMRGINLFELTRRQKRDPTLASLHTLHQILGNIESDGLMAAFENVGRKEWPAAISLLEKAGATGMAGALAQALPYARAPEEMDDELTNRLEQRIFEDPDRTHQKIFDYLQSTYF